MAWPQQYGRQQKRPYNYGGTNTDRRQRDGGDNSPEAKTEESIPVMAPIFYAPGLNLIRPLEISALAAAIFSHNHRSVVVETTMYCS